MYTLTQEEINELDKIIADMPTRYGMPLAIFFQKCFSSKKEEAVVKNINEPINNTENGNI